MPSVKLTSNLNRFFPDLRPMVLEGKVVSVLLRQLDKRYPGIKDYILDEKGNLRTHINIYINDKPISDREGLSDTVGEHDEIFIMQAISGG